MNLRQCFLFSPDMPSQGTEPPPPVFQTPIFTTHFFNPDSMEPTGTFQDARQLLSNEVLTRWPALRNLAWAVSLALILSSDLLASLKSSLRPPPAPHLQDSARCWSWGGRGCRILHCARFPVCVGLWVVKMPRCSVLSIAGKSWKAPDATRPSHCRWF